CDDGPSYLYDGSASALSGLWSREGGAFLALKCQALGLCPCGAKKPTRLPLTVGANPSPQLRGRELRRDRIRVVEIEGNLSVLAWRGGRTLSFGLGIYSHSRLRAVFTCRAARSPVARAPSTVPLRPPVSVASPAKKRLPSMGLARVFAADEPPTRA